MPTIHIIRTVEVPDGHHDAFRARLEQRSDDGDATASAALNALLARTVTTSAKQPMYDELDAWLAETDRDTVGEELMQVRSELSADLDLGRRP